MDELNERAASPMELEDRILPWSQVKVISGLSRTTVWRLQKTGDFPSSVQVSPNRVGWWQSEILEWRRSRLPRRLPERRSVEDVSPGASTLVKTTSPARETVPIFRDGAAISPRRSARRRSERPDCAHQTAFDFGS